MSKRNSRPKGKLTPEVRRALEAVAKAAGLLIIDRCTYCGENNHSECEGEFHTMLTFVGADPDEDDD